VKEFNCLVYWCENCHEYHTAPAPPETKTGLFSKEVTALIAYLKGRCHVSYGALQDFTNDVLKTKVSKGFLVKQIMKASKAMENTYEKLLNQLPREKHLHIDETGRKENGEKRWIWVFKAMFYAVFSITHSRSECTA
jgi:hypothetical protein